MTKKGAVSRAKEHVITLTLYLGAVAQLVAGFLILRDKLKGIVNETYLTWFALLIPSIPLFAVICFHSLPKFFARRRRKHLEKEGIKGILRDPGYFRLTPYQDTARDQERFHRADGVHQDVLEWLRATNQPVLYLTGCSGTGKTSLLNAYVLPRLQKESPTCRPLVVRCGDDAVAALRASLVQLWNKPPSDSEDVYELLRKAREYIRPDRLLVVLDQFEEFLILNENTPERLHSFEQLLNLMKTNPVPSVSLLVAFRSDYIGLLEKLSFPALHQDQNWKEVPPFRLSDARIFLQGSGLSIGTMLIDRILDQAAELEETRGLIRPITLNMIGLILAETTNPEQAVRLSRRDTSDLISAYLRDRIGPSEEGRQTLRNMITAVGTKYPCPVDNLAQKTGLKPHAVRGVLLRLAQNGLVRPLDKANTVWEISHDFVARLLGQILSSWRRKFWQAARPWIAPITLVLFCLMFIGFPALLQHTLAIEHLLRSGIQLYETDTLATIVCSDYAFSSATVGALSHQIDFFSKPVDLYIDGADDTTITKVTELKGSEYLRGISFRVCDGLTDLSPLREFSTLQFLCLHGCVNVIDLSPLRGLTSLQRLELANCSELTDLSPISNLRNLQVLVLDNCRKVSNLSPISEIIRLQTLQLNECREVFDLRPLRKLTNLQELDMTGCYKLSDLSPLKELTNLRNLYMHGCHKLSDLSPLSDLVNLKRLDVSWCSNVSDLSPLSKLTNLEELSLAYSFNVSDLTPLSGLTNLWGLDLDSCVNVSDVSSLSGLSSLIKFRVGWCNNLDLSLLRKLTDLQEVSLSECSPVFNLVLLSELPYLEHLELTGCHNTPNLTPVGNLTNLIELNLRGFSNVSDLSPLRGLRNLKELWVDDCDTVSEEAAGKLIEQHPDLQVIW